jgi:hypothetical protein
MLFGFTQALYLAGEAEQAAALLPLITQALAMGHDWMVLDGRLIQTRAGIAAAAARRWNQAEHHYQAALQLGRGAPQPHRAGRPPPTLCPHAPGP